MSYCLLYLFCDHDVKLVNGELRGVWLESRDTVLMVPWIGVFLCFKGRVLCSSSTHGISFLAHYLGSVYEDRKPDVYSDWLASLWCTMVAFTPVWKTRNKR